jgi:hypothetical protein
MNRVRDHAWRFVSSYRGYWIALVLLVVSYVMKSALPDEAQDPIQIVWALIVIVALPFVSKKSLLAAFALFAWLAVWYAIGLAKSDFRDEDILLARLFITFPLLASLTAFYLLGEKGTPERKSIYLEVIILALLAVWVVFIFQEQNYVAYAVRAYGATNYLTISDLVAMLVLVTVSGRQLPLWLRGGWMLLGLMTCLLLGSRTTMVVLGASLLFGTLVSAKMGVWGKILAFFAASALLITTVAIFTSSFNESITYRFLTFENLAGDESLDWRSMFFGDYIRGIQEDVSCVVLACFPSAGEYVHNIFSVHQYFGMGGLIMLGLAGIVLFRAFLRGWKPGSLPLLFFCVVELVTARSWVSLVFPIFVGYVIAAAFFLAERSRSKARVGYENV